MDVDDTYDGRTSAHRHFERGEGKLKAVIYTTILLLAIYSAVKIVPAYVSEYQLADMVNRYTEEQIREKIFKIVQDLEIPAKREDIKVAASPAVVRISMDYIVPIDLFFYHLDLHFSPSSENKALF